MMSMKTITIIPQILQHSVISNKISDKKEIEFTLDNILDLVYWYGENIKELYYSLLEYYKTINLNNARDYENIYLDIIEGCDDND